MRAQYGCFGLGVLQEPDQLAWVGVDGELRAGFDVQSQPARERNHGLPAAQRRAGHDAKDGQVADAGGDFLRLHPPERAQCPPLIGCLRFATDAGVGMTKKQRNGFTSAGSRTLIPASPQVGLSSGADPVGQFDEFGCRPSAGEAEQFPRGVAGDGVGLDLLGGGAFGVEQGGHRLAEVSAL